MATFLKKVHKDAASTSAMVLSIRARVALLVALLSLVSFLASVGITYGVPAYSAAIFLLGAILISLLAGTVAYAVAQNALVPLHKFAVAIDRMSGQDLSERIVTSDSSEELQRVSMTINALLERLESSFTAQEEFLAHASHQLKTPLAIIKGELDVLRQKDRTTEQIEQFFVSASEELTHLGRLVGNLLLLTRIQAGHQNYTGSRCEFEEAVMTELPWLDRLAKRQNVRISLNMVGLDEALIAKSNTVQGDPELLGCMIANVVENAIKYSPSQSAITLTCDFRNEKYVEFTVKDSGNGIAPEVFPQIFDRFYRNPEINSGIHGTGLGLALVKQIARLYNCHLNVQSSAGSGTSFAIKFPKSSI
jgi:signal transduction histidine kinase